MASATARRLRNGAGPSGAIASHGSLIDCGVGDGGVSDGAPSCAPSPPSLPLLVHAFTPAGASTSVTAFQSRAWSLALCDVTSTGQRGEGHGIDSAVLVPTLAPAGAGVEAGGLISRLARSGAHASITAGWPKPGLLNHTKAGAGGAGRASGPLEEGSDEARDSCSAAPAASGAPGVDSLEAGVAASASAAAVTPCCSHGGDVQKAPNVLLCVLQAMVPGERPGPNSTATSRTRWPSVVKPVVTSGPTK